MDGGESSPRDGRKAPPPRRPRAEDTTAPLPPVADLEDGPPQGPCHPRHAVGGQVSAGTSTERAAGPSYDAASGDDIRSHNLIKTLVSQFLAIPSCKSESFFNIYPPTGLDKGFLNYFAQAPLSVRFSSEEETGPSKFEQFSTWLMKNIDPEDVFMKNFVKMVFELNGISIDEFTIGTASVGPTMASWINPAMRSFWSSIQAIQKQVPKLKKSASEIEITSPEGVKVLGEVRDIMSRIENLVKDVMKGVENSGKPGAPSLEPESVARTFVENLKKINEHDLSVALQQIDKTSQLANIPFAMKKRLDEMKVEIRVLKTLISGMTGAWGLNNLKPDSRTKADSVTAKPDSVTEKPDSVTEKPESGTIKPAFIVPILPFHKVGKVACDILNKDYLGDVSHRAEMSCQFGTELNSLIAFKMSTAPDACAVLRHQQLLGASKVIGDLRLVLPFKNRLDEAGAVVPVKQTCMGKLMYLNEHACMSATVGLHNNPLISFGGMVGCNASFFGTTSLCGGGRLTVSSADGSVSSLEAAMSLSNPEWWGTVSATASLLEQNKVLKVFYNQKVLENTTIAGQLEYNHQNGRVVACGGVEHKHHGATLKAMIKTDGIAQALLSINEGIAGSRLSASVRANLRELDQPPKVGFSVSVNPTWG